tara:strand:+ start:8846 stop:9238 length:393 start_codon:yes stop_codon:yes gene_type:complete
MLKWFKKKEYVHKEICITKIILNNGVDFNYEYVVEIASIELKNSSIKERIIKAVNEADIDFFLEIPTSYSKKDLIRVYTLNGIESNRKMILALVDEANSKEDPYVLAMHVIKATNKPSNTLRSKESRIAP